MSILWLILVSLGWSGYRGNYDAIGIDIKWFSASVLSFVGLVVLVGDIRILMFPIAASIPLSTSIINEFEFDWYDNWYYETYLGNLDYEYDRIKGIWTLEKKSRDDKKYDFIGSFVLFLGAIYFFFFLMACFSSTDEGFKKMVALGTITNAAFSMLIVWMIYNNEKEVRPMRKAMGGKVSHDAISKLKRMYPRGLDVDRIQFLLHDALKQRLGNNANITTYGSPIPWYRFDEEKNNTKKIMTLFRVFPGIVSTMDTPDDEGDIPFRLACQYASVEVVKHMVGLDNKLLNIRDIKGNTVMHYACQGNNYKVVNYLLNRHMILAVTRNFDGDLPVYILCSSELLVYKHRLFVEDAPRPQHLETVMRLMLAYPEDMQREKLRAASPSKEKVPIPAATGQAMDSEEGSDQSPSSKPQKPLKLLIYIILVVVNMAAAVYIGTLQSFSNTNQMKHESEVKRLVDELVESQNEMNMLRSRMEVLKHASGGHSHSMLKVI